MAVDFDSILKRIVKILSSDSAIRERIDKFRYGELSKIGYRLTESECHVYTPQSFLTTGEQYGRTNAADTQFTTYVDIKVNGFGKEPEASKRDMLEKAEIISKKLMEDTTLKDPETDSDPLATRMYIMGMEELGEFRGKLVPVAVIHLKIQVGSEIMLTIPVIGTDIPVLFAPTGSDNVGYATHLSVMGKLKGYAAITQDRRTRYYDIEKTVPYMDSIDMLRRQKTIFDFTVKESGIAKTYKGYIERASPGQAYDGTPMISLQIAII